jgi:hypothetical protein
VIINIEKLLIFENVHLSLFPLKIYQNFKSNQIVFTISQFCLFYFNIINLLVSLIHSKFTRNLLFHEFMLFAHISKMKYFQVVENILFYLYMLHMCLDTRHSCAKNTNSWKNNFCIIFFYQIVGREICDEHPTTLEPLTCDKGHLEFIHIENSNAFLKNQIIHFFNNECFFNVIYSLLSLNFFTINMSILRKLRGLMKMKWSNTTIACFQKSLIQPKLKI